MIAAETTQPKTVSILAEFTIANKRLADILDRAERIQAQIIGAIPASNPQAVEADPGDTILGRFRNELRDMDNRLGLLDATIDSIAYSVAEIGEPGQPAMNVPELAWQDRVAVNRRAGA